MLKHPNSRACALETVACFLALPVPCVPGTGENARGREALGTRMILARWPISFPEHARSQVKGGHSSGEIELIHVEFPT